MAITARNYAAQAEACFMRSGCINKKFEVAAAAIRISTNFVIPDGGKIFDCQFKGLVGSALKMPFPVMTIEYFDSRDAIKVCHLYIESDEGICSFSALAKASDWRTAPVMGFMSLSSCNSFDLDNIMSCLKYEWLSLSDDKSQKKIVLKTIGSAFGGLFELCEALSCKNVVAEPLEPVDPAKNARRIKDGKLPIYETKILTIKAPEVISGKTDSSGGTHSSPRQHLRRGHIRRLPNCNIWVNACVVGSPENGIIEKSYNIRKAA